MGVLIYIIGICAVALLVYYLYILIKGDKEQ